MSETQSTPERTAQARAEALARDMAEWEANEGDLPANERFSRPRPVRQAPAQEDAQ